MAAVGCAARAGDAPGIIGPEGGSGSGGDRRIAATWLIAGDRLHDLDLLPLEQTQRGARNDLVG